MRRIKCEICGKRFEPKLYTAIENVAAITKLTVSPKKYDACDCPNCGRQIILGIRYDRSGDMLIPECLMEEAYEKIEEDGINEERF